MTKTIQRSENFLSNYNYRMRFQRFLSWSIVLLLFGMGAFYHPQVAQAGEVQPAPNQVSAYNLILAMNTLRVSYGLPALVEDSIIDAVV